ncbi:MAG: T9SS type A sorting domain-containing protein [Saprospiraceae bacterium]|nr:T9SS type A sorting domain-containing protein [Saprospiraceae bacterium]
MKTKMLAFLVWITIQSSFLNAQESWQLVTGLPQVTLYDLEVSGDSLLAAGINKLYVSADGGATWDSTAVLSPTVDFITDILRFGSKIYVSTQNEGIFTSVDGGQSWQTDNSGLNGLGATHIAMMARRGAMIFVATYGGGIFTKAPYFPGGWQSFSQGLTWQNVESITNIDGQLYAGAGANATLFTRRADQNAWLEYAFDEFNGEINAFLGIIKEGDVLIAAGQQGFYRSTNNGGIWDGQPTGYGLISSVRFESNGQGRVWAHMAKGSLISTLRYTDDAGLTWHNFDPGFTNTFGTDIVFFQNKLYYARSNGLWRLESSTFTDEPDGLPEARLSIYPNPTSGTFHLQFDLEQKSTVDVIVLDVQGRSQTVVFSGECAAGNNVLPIQRQTLTPGLYQIMLKHSGGIQMGKVVIGL